MAKNPADYFEALGYALGTALAAKLVAERRTAAPLRRVAAPAPQAAALAVGARVAFRRGRGFTRGRILRRSLDGRFVVVRDRDQQYLLVAPERLTAL